LGKALILDYPSSFFKLRRDKSAFAVGFGLRSASFDPTSRPDKKSYKIQQET